MSTESDSCLPAKDTFAAIATMELSGERRGMESPERVPCLETVLPLKECEEAELSLPRTQKIDTPEALEVALKAERIRMAPYMRNLAPELPATRILQIFQQADWRIEGSRSGESLQEALAGEGKWESVSIPHYGPPLGKASTLYRVTFDLPESFATKESLFLCFDAVDYRCQPYLNGVCLGEHEGIFEPFEFEISTIIKAEGNVLLVRVENDFTMLGEAFKEGQADGDKIYAATGLGYDDPERGWHHCPAGMGIWQPFRIEGRSRLAVADVYVQPSPALDAVELYIEVDNYGKSHAEDVGFQISIYGQNFEATVYADRWYSPNTQPEAGFGDLDKELEQSIPLLAGSGRNYFKLTLSVPEARIWELETPWLYQAQVRLLNGDGDLLDAASQQFGMRSFVQDETTSPKGKFYLNGREIRLRGANTMGNLDLCVFRNDTLQLIDDILLARLSHMNFLRLTQHPVQKQVYEYCDRLGMLLQTDLPLFGTLRRNQFLECVRQAGAMEKLVRSHPSNILVSFINEPFPNGRSKPHRFLERDEMQLFYKLAIEEVHRHNKERVIKCVDGDYDPPAAFGMPDNHCYCGWYLGHGVDLGQLYAGYWLPVKSGWHYGCGEFGAEGLDSLAVMKKHYPKGWLPATLEADWNPGIIPKAQSSNFHGLWYDTPTDVESWITASQEHQEWVNRLMTETFRRMPGMNTFAVHLFIDAWPAGWMKTLMDVNRIPKKSWFSYRDALTPLAVSLRCDRTAGVAGETISVEPWVVNDLERVPDDCELGYTISCASRVWYEGKSPAKIAAVMPQSQGALKFQLPEVTTLSTCIIHLSLMDAEGQALHDTKLNIDVYPNVEVPKEGVRVHVLGDAPAGYEWLRELGHASSKKTAIQDAEVILITDIKAYLRLAETVDAVVRGGAVAFFFPLPVGSHRIGASTVEIKKAGMGPRHFVSCQTGHPMVVDFKKDAFKFWYDESCGYPSPMLKTTFIGERWKCILETSDGGWERSWGPAMASAEKGHGQGKWRICQVDLQHRIKTNPAARIFASRLLEPIQTEASAAIVT
ncbi:MAG: Beta-galactosidase [Opitutia bacterium UBA7350]|nr:MAG: Beta-galactosidase [Opitutae bacterium UBA7350]